MKFTPLLIVSALAISSFPGVAAERMQVAPAPKAGKGAAGPRQGTPVSSMPGAASAEAYYLFIEGRRLESSGDVQGAIRAYRNATKADPRSGQILAELAALYARQNQPREAIATAEAALRVDPGTTDAHWVLGNIYAAYVQSEEPVSSPAARAAERDYAVKAIGHLEAVEQARGNLTEPSLMLTLGRLYLTTADYDKAIAALSRFAEQEPDAVEGIGMLAEAYVASGKTAEATTLLEQAAAREPSFYAVLAELYGRTGQWNAAADAYRRAAESGSNSTDLKRQWAVALLNAQRPGDNAVARDLLQQVLAGNPKDTRALYLLSQAQRQSNDLASAAATARNLLALEPESPSGRFALALVYEQQHDFKKVVEALQPVADRLPASTSSAALDLAPLLVHLGLAYVDLGESDRAVATLERAKALAPDSAAVDLALIQAQMAGKHIAAALDTVRTAREQHPEDMRFARLEADALRQNGQIDRGISVLEQAQKSRPDDAANYVALAELLMSGNRHERAAEVLKAARSRFPDDLSVLFELGALLEHQKRYAEAEDAFRQVIARDPKHAEALNYLGYMLADRGVRLNEAIEYIRRALEVEPNNPAFLDSLGWVYFKMNRLDLAETNLRQAVTDRSNDSVVQDHWGDLQWKLGRREAAVAAWRRALAGDGESIDRAAIEAKIRSAGGSTAKK